MNINGSWKIYKLAQIPPCPCAYKAIMRNLPLVPVIFSLVALPS